MSIFGNQTVTFVPVAPAAGPAGAQDELGTRTLTGDQLVDAPGTDVVGCRHRPLSTASATGGGLARAEQQPEVNVSVATIWWKTTAPPDPAVLAAKPADVLRVDGDVFQIIGGIQVFPDGNGEPFKVTLLSERQQIG